MKENAVESLLIKYLLKRGHYVLGIDNVPYNRFKGKKSTKAIPDIIGVSKCGKSIAIEVKTSEQYGYIQRNLDKWLKEKNTGKEWSHMIEHYIAQHYMLMQFSMRGAKTCFASDIQHLVNIGL